MRTPDDITAAAVIRYRRAWRDALLTAHEEPIAFPLHPPTAATIMNEPRAVAEWLVTWRNYTTEHPNATLRTRTVSTRHGDQPVHTHLDLADTAALADLDDDTRAHWQRVTTRWAQLQPTVTSIDALRPWLTRILDLPDADLALLRSASNWFRRNPHSGLTIRRVPVPGMHTKWLARHRRLVLAVLGHTTDATTGEGDPDNDPDAQDLPASELDALGLRPVPREADIVLADPNDRADLGGLRHLRAPIDELARLPLTPRCVLVVENKEAALSLPDTTDLVIVHSLGNHTDALRHLPWLPTDRTFYWGDIDRHGYTMLSRARTILPGLRSVLMSSKDVDRYRHLTVTEDAARYDLPDPTLDADETQALALLTTVEGYLRIEQERIPADDADTAVNAALGSYVPGGPATAATSNEAKRAAAKPPESVS